MRIRELRVSYVSRCDSSMPSLPQVPLATPLEAARLFQTLMGSEAVEVFGLLCLTTKYRLLCYHELCRGTLDAVIVYPRDVVRIALFANAGCVIVGHNHPSGDPSPSPHDCEVTRRLVAAATVMGIEVVDHIIVGDGGRYCSFKETGQM